MGIIPPDPATIAQRIRAARERIGSRATVAKLLDGLSYDGLVAVEEGGNPTLRTLFALHGAGIKAREIVPELFGDDTTEGGKDA